MNEGPDDFQRVRWLALPVIVFAVVTLVCFLFVYEHEREHFRASYIELPLLTTVALGILAALGTYRTQLGAPRRLLRAALAGVLTSVLVLPILAISLWWLYGSM